MPAAPSFVCEQAADKASRHDDLNDVVARTFFSTGVPVLKEPAGLCRTDGKRPNGIALISLKACRQVCCVGRESNLYYSFVLVTLIPMPARQALQPKLQLRGRRPNTITVTSSALVFSERERELTFTFARAYLSPVRLSVCISLPPLFLCVCRL